MAAVNAIVVPADDLASSTLAPYAYLPLVNVPVYWSFPVVLLTLLMKGIITLKP